MRRLFACVLSHSIASYAALAASSFLDRSAAGSSIDGGDVVVFVLWPVLQPLVFVHYLFEGFTIGFDRIIIANAAGYILVLVVAFRLLRKLRTKWNRELDETGKCNTCGYDLRATRERCPECGTILAKSSGGATGP